MGVMTGVENRVGVIGWPVEHSLSPVMHNAAFAALGMTNWHYERIPIPPDIVRLSIRELRDHGYIGINVTVPHKQEALYACKPDPIAQRVGAVNTIDFRTNVGTNTDVEGLLRDLQANDVPIAGQTIVVLGAGGAARAAVYGLSREGAAVIVVNRTPERAQAMVKDLLIPARVMTAAEAAAENPTLIVNATSAGMVPDVEVSPWPADVPLPRGVIVYDMVYRPAVTRLMQQAAAAGGRAINGLGMLVRQGAAAFELWTGQNAPIDVMFAAARAALKRG
jgi:shikimate dehydrogenase